MHFLGNCENFKNNLVSQTNCCILFDLMGFFNLPKIL